jgi:uncharacterized protein (TIGR02145 family)
MSSCGNANAQDNSTIKIGTQNWMCKNIDVSTYRNGDAIPQVQDVTEWARLTTGAWCYYENKSENGSTYGKLYNWYAVNDNRGLAPEGFHIPSDEEWTILTDYLGGKDLAGTKMKSISGWLDNGNGTNASGFAGFPGGYRNFNGAFINVGYDGYWWSSSENDTNFAWPRLLGGGLGDVYRLYFFNKRNGLSVCFLGD